MTGYTFVEVDVEIDQRRQRQRRTQNPVKHQGWNFLRKLLTKESILSSEYVPASQKLASLIISWTVITKFRRYRWKHDRNVLSRKVLIHNMENCHRITRVQQVAMVSGLISLGLISEKEVSNLFDNGDICANLIADLYLKQFEFDRIYRLEVPGIAGKTNVKGINQDKFIEQLEHLDDGK